MLRVLIVDEEERSCERLQDLVDWERLGCEKPLTCGDGVAALELMLSQRPDVVFVEIRLPGMDGIELIRHAEEHALDCDFVIHSRYHRFEYAQSVMRMGVEEYLLKPAAQDEIERVLEKFAERRRARAGEDVNERMILTRRLLRNSFMESFTGPEPPRDFSIESLNQRYRFKLREGIFQSAILVVDGLPPEEEGVFLPGLAENLRARFDPVCYEMIPFVQANQRLTMTLNYAPHSGAEERLPELLDILREHLQKRGCTQVSYSVGVGNPETNVRQLRHTLDTAERAVRCGILRGRNQIYWYGRLKFDAIQSYDVLTPTLISEMKSSAAILDKKGFDRAVRSAFAPVSSYTDPAVVIDICHAAITAVCDACEEAGYGPVSEENELDLRHRLGDETTLAGTIADLMAWAAEQFDRCLEERKNSRPVRAAKDYIAANYMNTLTLEHIAEQVHLNASYFSMMFKKETGQNFLDYLTAYRVEVAKRLLREGDLNISAICKAVGYADSKYFSRIFTKLVGIKPSAYRALHG